MLNSYFDNQLYFHLKAHFWQWRTWYSADSVVISVTKNIFCIFFLLEWDWSLFAITLHLAIQNIIFLKFCKSTNWIKKLSIHFFSNKETDLLSENSSILITEPDIFFSILYFFSLCWIVICLWAFYTFVFFHETWKLMFLHSPRWQYVMDSLCHKSHKINNI